MSASFLESLIYDRNIVVNKNFIIFYKKNTSPNKARYFPQAKTGSKENSLKNKFSFVPGQ